MTEDKQLLKEIRLLEGTRDKVIANEAMRSKNKEAMGHKDDIQGQVKVIREEKSWFWRVYSWLLCLNAFLIAVNGCWFGWSEEREASDFRKDQ